MPQSDSLSGTQGVSKSQGAALGGLTSSKNLEGIKKLFTNHREYKMTLTVRSKEEQVLIKQDAGLCESRTYDWMHWLMMGCVVWKCYPKACFGSVLRVAVSFFGFYQNTYRPCHRWAGMMISYTETFRK